MAGIEWMRSREIETENGYVKETEFRLTSKLKSLELLGRHLGMFTDRVELSGLQAEQGKLDALIQATTNDMRTAETAILRMANDQYRKSYSMCRYMPRAAPVRMRRLWTWPRMTCWRPV